MLFLSLVLTQTKQIQRPRAVVLSSGWCRVVLQFKFILPRAYCGGAYTTTTKPYRNGMYTNIWKGKYYFSWQFFFAFLIQWFNLAEVALHKTHASLFITMFFHYYYYYYLFSREHACTKPLWIAMLCQQ